MTIVLIGLLSFTVAGLVFLCIDRKRIVNEKNKLQDEFKILSIENEKLKVMNEAQKETSQNNFVMMQKTLEEKFENISNKVLKTQKEDLQREQKENLANILNPFKMEIGDFKNLIQQTNKMNTEDKGFLKKELSDLRLLNSSLSKNADDLVNALKGNSKIQGDWGENQLKNILDMAGYLEGQDYQMQFNLKSEDGDNLRPDCIICLPDGKKLIVDSKVSISNYVDYMKSENPQERKHYLELHVSSIKKHINELATKEYQKLLKDNSLDFVFMFIPNEQAYIEALKCDNKIYDTAYKANVAITTPSSILPILRTVKNLWNIENQNKNASLIAEKAGKLYDKLVGFVENMKKIDKNLINAKSAYDDAFNQLSDGRGSALSIAEDMKEMGAKTTKQIKVENKSLLLDENK